MPSTHIRPKIRKTNAKATKSTSTKPPPANDDDSVDALERKMGSWIGLSSEDDKATSSSIEPDVESTTSTITTSKAATTIVSTSSSEPAAVPPDATQTQTIQATSSTTKPLGILKKPKYSSTGTTDSQSQVTKGDKTNNLRNNKKAATGVVCEPFVVERDPFQKPPMRKTRPKDNTANYATIEGYEPSQSTPQSAVSFAPGDGASTDQEMQGKGSTQPIETSSPANTTTNAEEEEMEEPIVLSSLEELFEAAGNELPADRTKVTPDAKLVEADLAFSVMTQEQYGEKVTEMKRELAQEQQDMYRMFMGNEDVFDDGDSTSGREESDEDSEGEEEFANFLMEQEMGDADGDDYYQDDDEEGNANNAHTSTPRAFALIWGALARWWTPEAVEWMARLERPSSTETPLYGNNWSPQVDRSDIGASRCAGLMAMVKMYLPSSMHELGFQQELQRTAESRIADWLRTFDYSSEAPKLPVKMWKAISCMLLDMVLVESRKTVVEKLPPSVAAVGMSLEEYKYLTRSAVQAFQPP
ncbi:unnamed protein product [Cylindrotheca closterium]|uniref:Uncharacterized protein n=1 Tax=Cylindrotheca closterium TaxID=2856 RepID=A0AAD2FGD5_9STRA|nr:unnamed protein product [Cylindrotheca closterium]